MGPLTPQEQRGVINNPNACYCSKHRSDVDCHPPPRWHRGFGRFPDPDLASTTYRNPCRVWIMQSMPAQTVCAVWWERDDKELQGSGLDSSDSGDSCRVLASTRPILATVTGFWPCRPVFNDSYRFLASDSWLPTSRAASRACFGYSYRVLASTRPTRTLIKK